MGASAGTARCVSCRQLVAEVGDADGDLPTQHVNFDVGEEDHLDKVEAITLAAAAAAVASTAPVVHKDEPAGEHWKPSLPDAADVSTAPTTPDPEPLGAEAVDQAVPETKREEQRKPEPSHRTIEKGSKKKGKARQEISPRVRDAEKEVKKAGGNENELPAKSTIQADVAKASDTKGKVNRKKTLEKAVPKPAPKPEAQPKRKSYTQRIKEREAQFEKDKEKYAQLVDDIVAGKFKKDGGGQPQGNMRIKMPTPADRANTRLLVLGGFREQYKKLGRSKNCPSAAAPPTPTPATTMYSSQETEALKIEGGHRPMPRPQNIDLPSDFRKSVGVISLEELSKYSGSSKRLLVSVYGDIFDVSDRPDKYDVDGPYSWMTGNDITWGFVSGKDTPEQVNQCYDLWKVAPDHFRDSKLKLIYAWVAFYEYEYGDAVGKLDLYANEAGLKGPPMEEAQDCCVM